MSDPSLHDFLQALAHALRKPLTPVRAAAEELRMRAPDPNSQRMGAIIFEQVAHMERLIGAILDLSLLQRGRLQMSYSSIELLRVLEAAVEECRPALESKSQRLIVDLPDQALQVEGDEPRLVQIMRNLLDNAVKFTPDGGSIRLSIAANDSHAQVQVQDTGVGLTPTALSRLFDPFVFVSGQEDGAVNGAPTAQAPAVAPTPQAEGSSDSPSHETGAATTLDCGVGLSLIITKHLVELHNGSITATSEGPGQGSQFCVSLPLASSRRS
jgi:signal transduction histidine kinase